MDRPEQVWLDDRQLAPSGELQDGEERGDDLVDGVAADVAPDDPTGFGEASLEQVDPVGDAGARRGDVGFSGGRRPAALDRLGKVSPPDDRLKTRAGLLKVSALEAQGDRAAARTELEALSKAFPNNQTIRRRLSGMGTN